MTLQASIPKKKKRLLYRERKNESKRLIQKQRKKLHGMQTLGGRLHGRHRKHTLPRLHKLRRMHNQIYLSVSCPRLVDRLQGVPLPQLGVERVWDLAFMVNSDGLIRMPPIRPREILVALVHMNSHEPLLILLRRVIQVVRAYWTD